jgi:hypothetical protein
LKYYYRDHSKWRPLVEITVVWNLIGTVLMLALAMLAIEEAGSRFQIVVFLVVLIGYQRLSWLISEEHQANRIRYLRAETWFHRLDSAIRAAPPPSPVAASLVAGVGNAAELEELRDVVTRLSSNRRVELWLFRVTEMLLLLAVAWVVIG